jgi:Meiotically up-regulated gene 113
MSVSREHVLAELKRLAARSGGRAPGRRTFERETGIRMSEWFGVYWARWGDALAEADLSPNQWQPRLDPDAVLGSLAMIVRHLGHTPTEGELRIYARAHPESPGHDTYRNHFGTKADTIARLRQWVGERPDFADVAALLGPDVAEPAVAVAPRPLGATTDGFVYLIRSGPHHKIGRSDELERRVKQIRVALPEAAVLEHSIRTDDPAAIEAYWHRRFADRRAKRRVVQTNRCRCDRI